jgi:hypothetical protein
MLQCGQAAGVHQWGAEPLGLTAEGAGEAGSRAAAEGAPQYTRCQRLWLYG